MGVIFINDKADSPCLMDCSAGWAGRFIRLCNFVCAEYDHPSVFLWDGEIIADFIYINLPSMESLFEKTSQNPDMLLLGWAQCVAGMLEIETKRPWREKWQDKFPHFRPRYSGVSRSDIPVFE